MSDIFISYASADRDRAELIAKAFSQQGWSVWWDRQIPPGKSFDEVIEQALSSARCVIVLWSKDSVSSRWVKTEAAEAAAKGILVPALVDKVRIPLEFKRIEAADLTDWEAKLPHIEFDQLLKTVAGILKENAIEKQSRAESQKPIKPSKLANLKWWLLGIGMSVVLGVVLFYWAAERIGFAINEHYFTKSPDKQIENPAGLPKNEELNVSTPQKKISTNYKTINLLSPELGGQLLVASSDDWAATIDGKEDFSQISYGLGKEAVYGFKDEQAAIFDTFTMLISDTNDYNVKEFELLVGNESPTGVFETLGKFQIQNMKLFKTPYQEFKFPPVKAKYLKVKILNTQSGVTHPNIHEFRLFGHLK